MNKNNTQFLDLKNFNALLDISLDSLTTMK